MRFALRTKLIAIGITISLAFAALLASSALISSRLDAELKRVQQQYLPKLELGPKLEHQLEQLSRAMQDAVAAKDVEALAQTRSAKDELLRSLADAKGSVSNEDATRISAAVEEFDANARDVSRRLIARETGEQLGEAIAAMQDKKLRALTLIRNATLFDRSELNDAFANVARAQDTAGWVRLLVSIGCMVVVLLLLAWLSAGLLQSVKEFGVGLERFGTGRFDKHIEVRVDDEFGAVARRANEMASSLARLDSERKRAAWLREGLAGLVDEVRGELEPKEVASRALRYLAGYVNAPAGVLYVAEGVDELRLLATHSAVSPPERFTVGEGLVGQAAAGQELLVIESPPPEFIQLRSGLSEGTARALVLLPVFHAAKLNGVLELAVFGEWSEQQAELLKLIRVTLAITLEVAQARERTRKLLAETQAQAARLKSQEEELRSNNEELQAQQEELRQANEELTSQTSELEAQRRALESKNVELESVRGSLEQQTRELATVSAYKSQFLTNMSHELRTPLNAMLLLSQLLAENDGKNLTAKDVEYCKTINAAGKDLLGLINQVLDLAKVESGTQELKLEDVELKEVVGRIERVFAAMAEKQGVALTVELLPGVPGVFRTDKQRVDQILTNLVGNALKFTKQGWVQLQVGFATADAPLRAGLEPRRTLAFTVKDTGVGIRREDWQRVFVPFEQVSSAQSTRGGGTGLGLPIAAELAELMGGELTLLHSAPGEGSTFCLFLPVDGPPADSPVAASHRPAAPPSEPAASAGRPLLLLIEDDKVFGGSFGEIVTSLGFDYLLAADGATGLALAKQRRPMGILLDVKLPDMNGFEVMERLKEDVATKSIPVHFVSAIQGAERAMALGAVGYLTKPASPTELRRVAQSLVARSHDGVTKVLVVEDDGPTGDSLLRHLKAERIEGRRAASAEEALRALGEESFSGIILDLSLPDTDGLQLLERIQQQRGASMPAVVVYTARSLSKTETRRLEAYADAIVLKDGSSTERLMNEVRLFVQRLKERLGARSQEPLKGPIPPIELSGKRVLVVDDDMRTVYALSAMLRAKGAQVVVADNGRAALAELAQPGRFDIVLMDIMMPEMDGYEAMRAIRKEARFARLPVVALTAKAMKDDEQKCLDAGASAYLAKPIDGERLFTLMKQHLP